MISELSDEVLEKLFADHWREIRGIMKEFERRRNVSNPK